MNIESEKLNLNLIKFFIVAVESKSLTEVSEKLGYSVSNVSTNISTLETQLGVKLLYRDPLKPTEVGQKIYETFKEASRNIEFASVLAKNASSLEDNKLSIGCQSHLVQMFLMDKIEKVIKENKNLKVELYNDSSYKGIMRKLKDSKLEFALLNFIPTDEDIKEFEIKEIFESEYIFVANENIKINDIKELDNYKFVISYDYRSSAKALKKYLDKYDINLETVMKCPDMETRIDCAKRGIGIAYILRDAVTKELEKNELYEVKLPIKLPKSTINLVYLKGHLTEVDKVFIKNYLNTKGIN